MYRKKYIHTLFLVLGILYSPVAFAQIDSLSSLLASAKKDSNKVNILNDIAWECKMQNADTARIFLQQAITLSKEISFLKGEAQAYNNWGVVETIHGNYSIAIEQYQKALEIRQKLDDNKGVASLLNNLGNLELEQEAYIPALDYFKKSLELRERLNDSLRMARVHYNISNTHEKMGNYHDALDHVYTYMDIVEPLGRKEEQATGFNMIGNIKTELEEFEAAYTAYQKALKIREAAKDNWGLATVYNNIGNSFDDRGEFNLRKDKAARALPQFYQAIRYHEKTLELRKALEDEEGEYASYNNMGLIYKNLGTYYLNIGERDDANIHFDTALHFLERSLDYRQSVDDQHGMMEIFNGIGDVKRRQGKYKEALYYAQQNFDLAETMQDQKFTQIAYKDMSRAYALLGDYRKAYDYRKLYDELRYSRLNEARTNQNKRFEIIYENRKKERLLRSQQHELALQDSALQKAELRQTALLGGAVALLSLLALLLYAYRIKNKTNEQLAEKNDIIKEEQQRSEDLLLNILPADIAGELKKNGKAKPKRYESVTVLFTDFQAFTKHAEQMSAEELVEELDKCFSEFDAICAKYNVEKIKTIGDAYMCVGGLPRSNETHVFDVLNVAIEIQAFMEQYKLQRKGQQKKYFEIRLGMHTGPVVAGIVGQRKFAYDIWGETVNTAARLESTGEVGKINISASTHTLVKHVYDCKHRGKIDAKNIGEIDMYFVEGLRQSNPTKGGVRRPA